MRVSTNSAILLRPAAWLTQPLTWLILAAVVAATAVPLSGAGIAQAQDAPAGLTATRGDQSVALGWTDPTNTNITKYQYRQDRRGWADVTGGATATTHTVTGLTDGTAYTFEVRAVNGAGDGVASNQATATPNTAPTVTTQADPSFAENGTGTVATYVATYADNTNFTWRLTAADSALLSISASGDLSFNAAPDFENPVDSGGDNTYNVNVIATDDAPAPLASAEYPVAITVTNVDEDGVVTLAPATAPKVGVEITATLSDPDGGVNVGSWKWESTPDGTVAWADISDAAAAAYTPVSGDTGNQLRAIVSYEDAEAASKTAMSAATVSTPFSYKFGAVTDPNGHTVTYSAILDDDSALPPWLRFNNATRTFSGTAQAGNEGAITVKVTVTDDGTPPKSTPGTFTITVGAAAECTALEIDQDDSTTPGDTVDLTLSFTPANCGPGALTSELTITLHEDIGVPDDFDKADVIIRAGGRFEPDWADYSEAEDGTHEIDLPGCQAWGPSSQNALGVCDRSGLPISIQLEDIQLPSRPSENGDGYDITIQWDDGVRDLKATIDVEATLARNSLPARTSALPSSAAAAFRPPTLIFMSAAERLPTVNGI